MAISNPRKHAYPCGRWRGRKEEEGEEEEEEEGEVMEEEENRFISSGVK